MSENSIALLVLGVTLALIQFLYRMWDKKDNKLVIDAITTAVESFSPHIDRTRKTYGIVKDLQGQHNVRDDDGRPMWYMPKEIIETQRELVQLTMTLANTQRDIVRLLDKLESKIDKHQEQCRSQFSEIDKKIA